MFQSIIDYFTSIDPILAALYASLFTWFLTALGASFVFIFKTMNRTFLDGMLVLLVALWSLLVFGVYWLQP